MNSTHDKGGNGRLEDDLDKISRVYAQLDAEEPPELLDLAIRNSARRAVEKKPRRLKFGWLHGLTTAAVFVLALSVVIHQAGNRPAAGDGVQFDRVQSAPAASPAKKQSRAAPSGQVHDELEEAAGTAKDTTVPATTAPVQQSAAADTDENPAVSEKATGKRESGKPPLERMADAPEDAGQASVVEPEVVAVPPPAEPVSRSVIDPQAERQLQAIIDMKRNGDGNWKTALKAFVDSHPGYPLPDELKD